MPIVGCLMQQLQRQCSVTYAKKKKKKKWIDFKTCISIISQ